MCLAFFATVCFNCAPAVAGVVGISASVCVYTCVCVFLQKGPRQSSRLPLVAGPPSKSPPSKVSLTSSHHRSSVGQQARFCDQQARFRDHEFRVARRTVGDRIFARAAIYDCTSNFLSFASIFHLYMIGIWLRSNRCCPEWPCRRMKKVKGV